jgi:hypothetical protein
MHEVLAGNYYRSQTESVPEQTWSSAGFLDAAVRGLLGLELDGASKEIAFKPQLPPEWDGVDVAMKVAGAVLDLRVTQRMDAVELIVANAGTPVKMVFAPGLPLGAKILSADFDGRAVKWGTEVEVPPGESHYVVRFAGGVSLIVPERNPQVGDPSAEMKVTAVALTGDTMTVHVDAIAGADNRFQIATRRRIERVNGGTATALPDNRTRIKLNTSVKPVAGYSSTEVRITFARN